MKQYQVYLLDKSKALSSNLCMIGEPIFEADDMSEASTFAFNHRNTTNQSTVVYQPSKNYIRDYYNAVDDDAACAAAGLPTCEQCGVEMHPFAGQEGDENVSGWGCDLCGWSFDTSREKI